MFWLNGLSSAYCAFNGKKDDEEGGARNLERVEKIAAAITMILWKNLSINMGRCCKSWGLAVLWECAVELRCGKWATKLQVCRVLSLSSSNLFYFI